MSRSNVKTVLSIASVVVLAPFVVRGASERPAVVEVRVWTGAGVAERATGTVIAPGKVLTVAHVLEGARRVEVDGESAKPLRRDAALDLAVLRVPGATGPPVRFGEADGELRVLTTRGGEAGGAEAGGGEAGGGEARGGEAGGGEARGGEAGGGEARGGAARGGAAGGGEARGGDAGSAVPARLRRRINARLVDQPGRPRRPSFELAADVVSGDSGAPVVDRDGVIVGVVYARSTRRGGTTYAVRTADLVGWASFRG